MVNNEAERVVGLVGQGESTGLPPAALAASFLLRSFPTICRSGWEAEEGETESASRTESPEAEATGPGAARNTSSRAIVTLTATAGAHWRHRRKTWKYVQP